MNVTINARLGYKDLFDDEPKSKEFYLKTIPEDMFLASAIISFANPKNILNNPMNILFLPENKHFRDDILPKLEIKLKQNYKFYDIICCLRIAELILKRRTVTNANEAEAEINWLKLILIVNDELNKEMTDGVEKKNLNHIQSTIFYTFYRYDLESIELSEVYVLLKLQIIKSVEFFSFLKNSTKLKPYLRPFLEKYEIDNWEDWIKNLVSLTLLMMTGKNDLLPDNFSKIRADFNNRTYFEYTLAKNKFYTKNCRFFDELSINSDINNNKEFKRNFITLREYPVYKIDEEKYLIISTQFFVEKIYTNIQTTFIKEINVPYDEKVNFKSISGEDFSERTLFYSMMKKSFPNRWMHISGEKFKSKGYKVSEPDYYLRFKNTVFLFECKDVSLTGFVKQSFDYTEIENGLMRKFYKEIKSNGKIKKRAILQLLENIKRVYNNLFERCDNGYDGKKVKIYPILITHNRQFDCLGINKLLNNWFKQELQSNSTEICIKNAEPLTLINIEIFLRWHEAINKRSKFIFEKMIDEFQKKAANQNEIDSNISFTYFFKQKMKSQNIPESNLNEYLNLFDY